MTDRQIVDDVRQAVDIAEVIGSYVQLKQMGHSLKGLCPFHKEKTPSFNVNPDRQAWYCFGCSTGGDVFKFMMMIEGVDFPTALRLLASRAGISIPERERKQGGPKNGAEGSAKDEIFSINGTVSKLYTNELQKGANAEIARGYLKSRQLDGLTINTWGIGYAPEGWSFLSDRIGKKGWNRTTLMDAGLVLPNDKGEMYDRFRGRVMFSIRDEQGRVVGFSGRVLNPTEKSGGKYVNTPETSVFRKSRILFGLDQAKREILDTRQAILCEGQVDCIRCHLAGFRTTVASQGTAFTEDHARLLKRYADSVMIVLDADAAGQKAALRSAEILMSAGMAVTLARLPEGEDPDSLILKKGADEFAKILANAQTVVQFQIGLFAAAPGGLQTPAGLSRAVRAVMNLISQVPSAVEREHMQQEAARLLGVGMDAIRADVRRAAAQKSLRQPLSTPTAPSSNSPVPISLPQEELELAILLGSVHGDVIRGIAQEYLRYDVLVDATCRSIIHALLEEVDAAHLMEYLTDGDEACQVLAARIVNAPQKVVGREEEFSAARAGQDVLCRIWLRYFERQKETIMHRLASSTDSDRRALQVQLMELLRDIKAIQRGWDIACPVLLRHIHSRDEVL